MTKGKGLHKIEALYEDIERLDRLLAQIQERWGLGWEDLPALLSKEDRPTALGGNRIIETNTGMRLLLRPGSPKVCPKCGRELGHVYAHAREVNLDVLSGQGITVRYRKCPLGHSYKTVETIEGMG